MFVFWYLKKSPLWDVEKAKCSFGFSKPKVNLQIRTSFVNLISWNVRSNYGLWILQSSEELKEEIAELEKEILQLERYLLSLYRTSFGDHLHAFMLRDDSALPPPKPNTTKFQNDRVTSVSDTSLSSSIKPLSESVNDLNWKIHILM